MGTRNWRQNPSLGDHRCHLHDGAKAVKKPSGKLPHLGNLIQKISIQQLANNKRMLAFLF